MSKHDRTVEIVDPRSGGNTMAGLIIFILIILQFSKRNDGRRESCKNEEGKKEECKNNQLFDNSTLFILVLFFVACCGKVKLGC